ncbi:MAG: type IV toxin-antitoxin system AbiEi family antitoxin domain-containing protein [Actinomycetota bacterium]
MRSASEPGPAQERGDGGEGAERAAAILAAKQHGLITRRDALTCGMSPSMIRRRIVASLLEPLSPGVYRFAAVAPTWHQALLAVCLAWGPGAVISHAAAAALWAFPGFAPGCIELIVPRGRRRSLRHTVHRPLLLTSADVTVVHAIPVTTPARTLFDVAGTSPRDVVEEALDDALRRGVVSLARLRWHLGEYGEMGRPGTRVLRSLVDARWSSGVPKSVFETRLLRVLKRGRLPAPAVQHEIRSRGRLVARVDAAYPDVKVAIEADSARWHASRQRWERDLARRNAITALGWQVLHITYEQLHRRPETVVRTVAALLQARRPAR